MLERRHCHPLYILERVVRLLIPIIVWVIVSISPALEEGDLESLSDTLSESGLYALIFIGCTIAVVLLITLLVWIGWLNRWVSAKNDILTYESGIIFKKTKSIPFSKINTIDMGRNLFQRIFGTCRLKIDTGALSAGTGSEAEMDLVFSLAEAEQFRAFILGRSSLDEDLLRATGQSALKENTEPKWFIKAHFFDFFLYGLTSSSVWRLFIVLASLVAFIGELSSSFLEKIGAVLLPRLEATWNSVTSHNLILMILTILVLFAIYALIANIWSVMIAAIKFYGFRAAREGDNIIIRYGLISLKNYTMPVRNIHAVIVNQNLFQQLIGRCSVELVSIGYGDEKTENSLLFPIIAVGRLSWLIDSLLPEYSSGGSVSLHTTDKRSIRFHILRPIFWSALVMGAGVAMCTAIMDSVGLVCIAALFILTIIAVSSVLNYKSSAIGWDRHSVVVRSGGLIRRTYYIRTDAVQSVRSSSGIFQRRHGLASYMVDYHAPLTRAIAPVKHLDVSYTEALGEAVDIL